MAGRELRSHLKLFNSDNVITEDVLSTYLSIIPTSLSHIPTSLSHIPTSVSYTHISNSSTLIFPRFLLGCHSACISINPYLHTHIHLVYPQLYSLLTFTHPQL
ncbi:hypothetical protein FIBSPDRAFT_339324 [Athelia psychrophila]|uniref:Uncharacterized protein n=1 Tax=Athelia psychrophila TaxID=1759441 RepID=A0A167W9E2_9AGAM|nr:hypothetical protein FIBSPDRAFT_339324 [Fibularhizoctonia sp. CBS 109695]